VTDYQTIALVKIMKLLPEPTCLRQDRNDLFLSASWVLRYDGFDIRIDCDGDAYRIPARSIKPIKIYDASKRKLDLDGLPVDPIDTILKVVGMRL